MTRSQSSKPSVSTTPVVEDVLTHLAAALSVVKSGDDFPFTLSVQPTVRGNAEPSHVATDGSAAAEIVTTLAVDEDVRLDDSDAGVPLIDTQRRVVDVLIGMELRQAIDNTTPTDIVLARVAAWAEWALLREPFRGGVAQDTWVKGVAYFAAADPPQAVMRCAVRYAAAWDSTLHQKRPA